MLQSLYPTNDFWEKVEIQYYTILLLETALFSYYKHILEQKLISGHFLFDHYSWRHLSVAERKLSLDAMQYIQVIMFNKDK